MARMSTQTPGEGRTRHRRHPHTGRLGAGLALVGGAGLAHAIWGVAVDLPLLAAGAAGLLWASAARRPDGTLGGIVLVAVALFALLDDHGVFTGLADALTLLALATLAVLAHGFPVLRRDVWPIVPAGALALMAAFVVVRLAAVGAGAPWDEGAPILVAVAGLALLAWDRRRGRAPDDAPDTRDASRRAPQSVAVPGHWARRPVCPSRSPLLAAPSGSPRGVGGRPSTTSPRGMPTASSATVATTPRPSSCAHGSNGAGHA